MVDKWVISFISTLKTNTFLLLKYFKVCLLIPNFALERRGKTLERRGKTLERRGKTLERRGKTLERRGKTLER